jgi:hypothetical protein
LLVRLLPQTSSRRCTPRNSSLAMRKLRRKDVDFGTKIKEKGVVYLRVASI